MKELGITEAQRLFTKILSVPTLILDKKNKKKKAVILPFEEYERLKRGDKNSDEWSEFIGAESIDEHTPDPRYQAIVK